MEKKPDFLVGSVPIYGKAILSPMDGFSDQPYRTITQEFGSALNITEFVSCIDVVDNLPKVEPILRFSQSERPIVYQIYDSDPGRILEAALILRDLGPDIIDVNLGCSANAIANRGAGAGLLKEPKKIAVIIEKLVKNLDIPVTAKIRLGWDENSLNYALVSHIIEDNGGQMLAVHARTKEQGLRGEANWEAIAEIKHSLSIPVIGNGGIERASDIKKMLTETNCDAVMIGRAAMGNPWIFSGRELKNVSNTEFCDVILDHLKRMQEFYNEYLGLMRFRKHLKRYLRAHEFDREVRIKLLTTENSDEFISIIKEMFS